MTASGITNRGSVPVEIEIEINDDDGLFLGIRIESERGMEIADILIDTERDADELLEMVTLAVADFKRLKT
jgi:hypothetical protein